MWRVSGIIGIGGGSTMGLGKGGIYNDDEPGQGRRTTRAGTP